MNQGPKSQMNDRMTKRPVNVRNKEGWVYCQVWHKNCRQKRNGFKAAIHNKNTHPTQSIWNVKGGERRKKSVYLGGLQEKASLGKRRIPTKEGTQSNFSKGKWEHSVYAYRLGWFQRVPWKGLRMSISNSVALIFGLLKVLYCFSDKNLESFEFYNVFKTVLR